MLKRLEYCLGGGAGTGPGVRVKFSYEGEADCRPEEEVM